MDYPVKTLSQLRPILLGFRKAAGFTQATMAARLGVTQQTYAQLETNPATVSMDRLFKVLRVLGVELALRQTSVRASKSEEAAPTTSSPVAAKIAGAKSPPARAARKRAVASKSASANTTRRTAVKSARKQASAPKTRENW